MFDDLRKSADFKEEEPKPQPTSQVRVRRRQPKRAPFLGMTPPQRFVVALLIFIMTILFGAFCLLVSGKIVLPF
jgi:hypothetical protein